MSSELEKWLEAKSLMTNDDESIVLGPYFTHLMKHSPRRLLHMLSYYKFAAKMIGPSESILEVGCSEGFGAPILGEFAQKYVGLDIDKNAIDWAQKSFKWMKKSEFIHGDILDKKLGEFDAVASFDVIEHIYPDNEKTFLQGMTRNLKKNGTMIIGTPSLTSNTYANEHTRRGHINLYTAERLKSSLETFFNKVIVFSANDEQVHTGFWPLAHYYLAMAVGLKD